MNPTYTIATNGSDPANTLQIIGSVPSTQVTFQGTIADLQARIAAYPAQIQALQDQQTADEALLASITAIFTAAGVTDLTQPLTQDQTTAIQTQNTSANATVLQDESSEISSELAGPAIQAIRPLT